MSCSDFFSVIDKASSPLDLWKEVSSTPIVKTNLRYRICAIATFVFTVLASIGAGVSMFFAVSAILSGAAALALLMLGLTVLLYITSGVMFHVTDILNFHAITRS